VLGGLIFKDHAVSRVASEHLPHESVDRFRPGVAEMGDVDRLRHRDPHAPARYCDQAEIPVHLADEIAAEAVEMTAFEDFVTEKVKEGRSILASIPQRKSARGPSSPRGARKEDGSLALLWQIYSRRCALQIHFPQCGHR
jgi:hypothetical protein